MRNGYYSEKAKLHARESVAEVNIFYSGSFEDLEFKTAAKAT